MNVDIELVMKWVVALTAIISFAKLVIMPFYRLLTSTQDAIKDLQAAIKDLRRDMEINQRDRENIHHMLEVQNERINKVEDDVIRLDTYCQSRRD